MATNRPRIFLASVFFVLGFSVVFSLVGVLLQTVLSDVSYSVQIWLGRIGGVIIILFGLYLLGLIKNRFLDTEHKFGVTHNFGSVYLTSFVFGAAFAVGWTPCVGAVLGSILTLAATSPQNSFLLLVAYTLGLGIPFLLVGLFTAQAENLIARAGNGLRYIQYVFGVMLIGLGILVFTGELSRVASFEFATTLLLKLNAGFSFEAIDSLTLVNSGIAFLAGLGSFLSPCVLPLVPGFLSYLASTAATTKTTNQK